MEEITSKVYKRLFHYTSLHGLYGILKSQSLWATNYKFLNDNSEIILFRDKLISLLYPKILDQINRWVEKNSSLAQVAEQEGGLQAVAKKDTEALVDAHYGATGVEIYIASFCGEDEDEYINQNGLLSQWRGYGGNGGFVIIFKTQELEEMLKIEANSFDYGPGALADVVYSDDERKLESDLHEPISHILEYTEKLYANLNEAPPDATKAAPSFIQCVGRYKHCGFKEENEVRLVAVPIIHNEKYLQLAGEHNAIPKPEKERKFRDKNGEPVPYIELFGWPHRPLPIERIIVGPHKEKEARAVALRVMLRNTNIVVTASKTPYAG
jgi:hypothetical protein